MISVVPEDWKFLFVGSQESITFLNQSLGVQRQEARGKLDMVLLPSNYSVKGQEPLSRTMTDLWFWKWLGGDSNWDWREPYLDEMIIGPDGKETRRTQVEWMLVFQTDSIMCANSGVSLNSWLDWDYVGAPWLAHTCPFFWMNRPNACVGTPMMDMVVMVASRSAASAA